MIKRTYLVYTGIIVSISILIATILLICVPKTCMVDETYKIPTPKVTRPKLKISEETKDKIQAEYAAQKLKRQRPTWQNLDGIIEHNEDGVFEVEYNWTDGAAGFSQLKDKAIICGDNRTKLIACQIGMFSPSVSESSSSFSISMLNQMYQGQTVYTNFGQGCEFSWTTGSVRRNVYIAPVFRSDGVDAAVFTLQNGVLTFFDLFLLSNDAKSGWLTIDPISKCLFFCPVYNLDLESEARFFIIFNIETIDNGRRIRLTSFDDARVNSPIVKCTGGCFSDNGILYLLNNDDNSTGFSAYTFAYNQYLPGYMFTKVRDYRVYTPEESIWSNDNQDLVGIGYFNFPGYSRFIGILHKNEDIGTDNITYTMVEGLM